MYNVCQVMSTSNYTIIVPNSDYTLNAFVKKFLVDKFKWGQCGQVVLRMGCEVHGPLATESQIL